MKRHKPRSTTTKIINYRTPAVLSYSVHRDHATSRDHLHYRPKGSLRTSGHAIRIQGNKTNCSNVPGNFEQARRGMCSHHGPTTKYLSAQLGRHPSSTASSNILRKHQGSAAMKSIININNHRNQWANWSSWQTLIIINHKRNHHLHQHFANIYSGVPLSLRTTLITAFASKH